MSCYDATGMPRVQFAISKTATVRTLALNRMEVKAWNANMMACVLSYGTWTSPTGLSFIAKVLMNGSKWSHKVHSQILSLLLLSIFTCGSLTPNLECFLYVDQANSSTLWRVKMWRIVFTYYTCTYCILFLQRSSEWTRQSVSVCVYVHVVVYVGDAKIPKKVHWNTAQSKCQHM